MPYYVIAYHADLTLNVSAVGPYLSYKRATSALERLESVLDSHDITDEFPARIPQIVMLHSEVEIIALARSRKP